MDDWIKRNGIAICHKLSQGQRTNLTKNTFKSFGGIVWQLFRSFSFRNFGAMYSIVLSIYICIGEITLFQLSNVQIFFLLNGNMRNTIKILQTLYRKKNVKGWYEIYYDKKLFIKLLYKKESRLN